MSGEQTKLGRWLDGLPADLVFTKPQLCVFHAWILCANGQLDASEQSLQAAEQALEINTDGPTESSPIEWNKLPYSERMKIQGRTTAIRAFLAFFRGDVPGIIQNARQALEYLHEKDLTWRSTVAIVLGDAYSLKGEIVSAYQAQLEALEACKVAGDFYLDMLVNMKLAVILRSLGKLQQTIEICQQQMQISNEYGLSQTELVGLPLAIWGQVLAEYNDLDGALHQAKKGVELTERGGAMVMLGWSYICLINVLFSRGDLVGAEEIIQKMENVARESHVPPWIMNQMAAWQVRIWLAQDKLEAASQWVADRGLYPIGESAFNLVIDYAGLIEYVILTRILIAQEQLEQATGLLLRLLEAAETGGRTTRVIEIMILQALVLQAHGETDQALITLDKALTLAEAQGFFRIFVDEGLPMARLLYEAATRGTVSDYVNRLLAAFPMAEPEQTDLSKTQAPKSEMVEPLSKREIEVLQLIAEGLTNHEVASRLYLALSTIKVHNRNIYGKLGVNNRTQAVARARALGILPSNL